MISLLRVLRFAFQNFWRNVWLSVITVSMLTLTLLTVNLLLSLHVLTDAAIKAVENKVDVSLYFNEGTQVELVQGAAGYIRGLDQVRDVQIVTPEEALERFRARHAEDRLILSSLEEVGENPFGYTLIVQARDAADFGFILEALDHPQYRDAIREKDFSNYGIIIDRLNEATGKVRVVGLAVAAVLLLIAMLIIVNVVRMTIFIHRDEIGVMKLVGAGNTFVRAPYFLEAILYSATATGIAAAAVFGTSRVLAPRLQAYFGIVQADLFAYFATHPLPVFGLEFAALSALTILSTAFAMHKYLKV
ncbi:hypothetical protein HY734_02830 [Candidatus Uhrbacteria bacterium]|nr:hypothetical protein [Candidatus Uhrbacteria bacterium]